MNVPFRVLDRKTNEPCAKSENAIINNLEEFGFTGLKGHKSMGGGLRASIYNSLPIEGVEELVDFL
jgi:phosphoserine aminotransferase